MLVIFARFGVFHTVRIGITIFARFAVGKGSGLCISPDLAFCIKCRVYNFRQICRFLYHRGLAIFASFAVFGIIEVLVFSPDLAFLLKLSRSSLIVSRDHPSFSAKCKGSGTDISVFLPFCRTSAKSRSIVFSDHPSFSVKRKGSGFSFSAVSPFLKLSRSGL